MYWYLVGGKMLKLICYFIVIKYCYYFDTLFLFEKIFCYFFFEYIPYIYNISSGKHFITNKRFRIILKNLAIALKKILFKFYLTTFFKFCIVILLPWCLIYFLFSIKSKFTNYFYTIIMIFLISYAILNSLFKVLFYFNLLDFYIYYGYYINFILINVYYYYIYKNNLTQKFKNFTKLKIYIFKSICYFFLSILLVILMTELLNESSNNFLQEYLINFLIIYTYIYYKFLNLS